MPDPKPIERTSPISQVNRPLCCVGFEMRPRGVGVENGLRPTLCRSSESHLRQTHGGFFPIAKRGEMWYSMPSSQIEYGKGEGEKRWHYLRHWRHCLS